MAHHDLDILAHSIVLMLATERPNHDQSYERTLYELQTNYKYRRNARQHPGIARHYAELVKAQQTMFTLHTLAQ